MSARTVMIGIGSLYRRDDGVGLVAARQLEKLRLPHTTIREDSGEGATLMEMWQDADRVILIDAVVSGADAGTIHRLDAQTQPVPAKFFCYSSHAFSVAEAVELARVLHRLPPALTIYGIEGKDFSPGVGLSPEVEQVVQQVVARIREEIRTAIACVSTDSEGVR